MNSVKVSVIVPVYNAESLIKSTMQMLGQSELKDIEIIAVNDGSTDNSLSILKKCADEDTRIKVVDKENGGIFDARNYGLKNATGEYICFCDQDDVVEPQMYAKMYQTAKEKDCDLVMCSTGRILRDRKVPHFILPECFLSGDEVRKECLLPMVFSEWNGFSSEKGLQISPYVWKCIVKQNFIAENHLLFKKYVNYEDDFLFVLDILAYANKVATITDILYYWTINLDSESHAPKYVNGYYQKDVDFQNEVTNIMKIANCAEEYEHKFELENSAFRYSRLVWNETVHTGAPINLRLTNIKQIYGENNFKAKITASKFYPQNLFARKIVCRLLRVHLVFPAYIFAKIYTSIRGKAQDRAFWANLEKKAMNSGH